MAIPDRARAGVVSLKRTLLRYQLRQAGWRGVKAIRHDKNAVKQNQNALADVIAVRSATKLAPHVKDILAKEPV